MTYDVDDLQVSPKIFAKLAGTSVTKLLSGKSPVERVESTQSLLQEISALTGMDSEVWLTSSLVEGYSVTPLDVWKFNPKVEALSDAPEQELDRVCPLWRMMYKER